MFSSNYEEKKAALLEILSILGLHLLKKRVKKKEGLTFFLPPPCIKICRALKFIAGAGFPLWNFNFFSKVLIESPVIESWAAGERETRLVSDLAEKEEGWEEVVLSMNAFLFLLPPFHKVADKEICFIYKEIRDRRYRWKNGSHRKISVQNSSRLYHCKHVFNVYVEITLKNDFFDRIAAVGP